MEGAFVSSSPPSHFRLAKKRQRIRAANSSYTSLRRL